MLKGALLRDKKASRKPKEKTERHLSIKNLNKIIFSKSYYEVIMKGQAYIDNCINIILSELLKCRISDVSGLRLDIRLTILAGFNVINSEVIPSYIAFNAVRNGYAHNLSYSATLKQCIDIVNCIPREISTHINKEISDIKDIKLFARWQIITKWLCMGSRGFLMFYRDGKIHHQIVAKEVERVLSEPAQKQANELMAVREKETEEIINKARKERHRRGYV